MDRVVRKASSLYTNGLLVIFGDRHDLMAEIDADAFPLNVFRGPKEIVRELLSRGHGAASVDETQQAVLGVQV